MCDQRHRIRARGAEVAVVGNGSPEEAAAFVERERVPIPVYTDPARVTYRALGARRGVGRLFHPGTLLAAAAAALGGHRQRATHGDATQLGGVVIVRLGGTIAWRRLGAHPGDHPEPEDLLGALDRAVGTGGSDDGRDGGS